MKTRLAPNLITLMLALALPLASAGADFKGSARTNPNCQNLSSASLSQEEVDGLIFMREEEKMARDLYLSFNRLHGTKVRIFANIAGAEQTHMNAVKRLLDAFGLPDPVVNNPIGVFVNPEIQKLYNDLLLKGQTNLGSAFEVGVTVEETDIGDLSAALKKTDQPCIENVYLHLLRGSENHLRAFNRQLQ